MQSEATRVSVLETAEVIIMWSENNYTDCNSLENQNLNVSLIFKYLVK